MISNDEGIVAMTQAWLEKMVIGLNLCPFAKAVYLKNQVRFVVTHARNSDSLLEALEQELRFLSDANSEKIDTTLLIHPNVLTEFLDYNDFLDVCDSVVEELDLDGVLQVASFHPHYQFADTEADDVTNFTNRSPFPTLHLLREESVSRAVETFANVEGIYEKNIATLRKLGLAAIRKLMNEVRSPQS
jgi:uncharacterized protein